MNTPESPTPSANPTTTASKKSRFLSKPILSPFVAIAFLAISVTGILLFFHVKNGMVVVIHEWAGWGFVIVGAVHLLLNLKPLLGYLRLPRAWASTAVACLLVAMLAVIGLNHREEHHRRGEGGAAELKTSALGGHGQSDSCGDGCRNAEGSRPRHHED